MNRYWNCLNPHFKKGPWEDKEVIQLLELYKIHKRNWTIMREDLNRSSSDISEMFYNTVADVLNEVIDNRDPYNTYKKKTKFHKSRLTKMDESEILCCVDQVIKILQAKMQFNYYVAKDELDLDIKTCDSEPKLAIDSIMLVDIDDTESPNVQPIGVRQEIFKIERDVKVEEPQAALPEVKVEAEEEDFDFEQKLNTREYGYFSG
jgi:hypothetical protein